MSGVELDGSNQPNGSDSHSRHQSAGHGGVSKSSPPQSIAVRVGELLITRRYLTTRPVLMHFPPLPPPSSPHLTSAPSACFSADSGLWQSYLPFNPDQSYLRLLHHKHFISSTLTLTGRRCRGFGVKCLWKLVDAGLNSRRSVIPHS